MAGDWIKMRTDLRDDPAVISIAAELGIDEDTVVGKLHRLWSWADRQTVDGNALGVTETWIDRYLGVTGFALSLVNVGWLSLLEDGLEIPNFDRHNGQSAKRRALTARRVARHKVTHKALPREEKRREDINPPIVPQGTADGFDDFWRAYPKKVARAQAVKVWKKLGPDKDLAAKIVAAVKVYAGTDQWQRDSGRYIPHAATFLNQRRWEDKTVLEIATEPTPDLPPVERGPDGLTPRERVLRMMEATT